MCSSDLFSGYAQRQRARFLSFRRFVLGFYTREFRDLFFSEDPPKHIFRSVVTVFAGYWHASAMTRFWVWTFLALVQLQRYIPVVPRLMRTVPQTSKTPASAG